MSGKNVLRCSQNSFSLVATPQFRESFKRGSTVPHFDCSDIYKSCPLKGSAVLNLRHKKNAKCKIFCAVLLVGHIVAIATKNHKFHNAGEYFSDCKMARASALALDKEAAENLWKKSEEWTKL